MKSSSQKIRLAAIAVFVIACMLSFNGSGKFQIFNTAQADPVLIGCFIMTTSECPEVSGVSGGERVTCDFSGTTVPGQTCTPVVCGLGSRDKISCGGGNPPD